VSTSALEGMKYGHTSSNQQSCVSSGMLLNIIASILCTRVI